MERKDGEQEARKTYSKKGVKENGAIDKKLKVENSQKR